MKPVKIEWRFEFFTFLSLIYGILCELTNFKAVFLLYFSNIPPLHHNSRYLFWSNGPFRFSNFYFYFFKFMYIFNLVPIYKKFSMPTFNNEIYYYVLNIWKLSLFFKKKKKIFSLKVKIFSTCVFFFYLRLFFIFYFFCLFWKSL